MGTKGITLIELLVVVSIIGILAATLGFSFAGWVGKYKVESVTKQLFTDMMEARVRAMQRNRDHFVLLNGNSYKIIEDINENGVEDSGDTTLPAFPKTVEFGICKNGIGDRITFNRRGLISQLRTIWFTSRHDPDYDCMKVSMTRIIMGQYLNGSCEAK